MAAAAVLLAEGEAASARDLPAGQRRLRPRLG